MTGECSHGRLLLCAPCIAERLRNCEPDDPSDMDVMEMRVLADAYDALKAENERLKADAETEHVQSYLSHWFIQGGKQQFGMVAAENADGFVSAVLRVVRAEIDAANQRTDEARAIAHCRSCADHTLHRGTGGCADHAATIAGWTK